MVKSVEVPVSLPRMDLPVVDPKTGMVNQEWYSFFEAMRDRTGGDQDLVDSANVAAGAANEGVQEVKAYEIQVGAGLEGGGPISEGVTIKAKVDAGWVWATGPADKTTAYGGHSPIVGAGTYTPSQITDLSSAIAALSKRYVALEQALRSTEALKA